MIRGRFIPRPNARFSPGRRRQSRAQHGITLVELMVVVVIMGVLGAVGLVAMRRHLYASRTSEALATIQSIRAAEERYRAMNMLYLDVSTAGDSGWYPRNPTGAAGTVKVLFLTPATVATHVDNPAWLNLSPTVSSPVQFGYKVNAGIPGQAMTTPNEVVPDLVWGAPTEPWYVVQAIADADGDGATAYFLASSLTDAVYSAREGE
jgi:prepilin-type N-terminal cleavage/methylation domain-containing protein